MKEFRITTGNSNISKTYEMINTTTENDITDKHARFLKSLVLKGFDNINKSATAISISCFDFSTFT